LTSAVGAGALLSLTNPPADLGLLAFVGIVPLLWALSGASVRRGALLGFAFGLAYYAILLHWILPLGAIAWLPLSISQAAYTALFGAVLPLVWREERPLRSAAAGAALWTAVDWLRASWPLGGFAWGALGTTQHDNGLLLPLASVTGVWGVTFVVFLVNALIPGVLARVRTAPRVAAALVGVGLAASALPVLIPLQGATGPSLDVAVVQGNVPRSLASDRLLQSEAVGENHIKLHRELAGDPPDLAVWPENSLDRDPTRDPELAARVEASIRTVGVPTLVGAITGAPENRFYNQVIHYSGAGQVLGRYTKTHLVPFGEYVPFRPFFSWTDRYRPTSRDLAPGSELDVFTVKGLVVAPPICFENVFPDLFRRFVARGANLVILTTNDSTFLESVASREHVIMSEIRAVENGRWVVQAAISGESAVIDPEGRVVRRTGLFEQAILRTTVAGSDARTIYTRFGDWFPWVCGIGVLVALAFVAAVRREAGERGAPPAGEGRKPAHEGVEPLAPAPIAGAAEPRVLVILPTYNEAQTIAEVLAGVLAASPDAHALVIDDGSPDGTAEVVAAMAEQEPRVRLIRRSGKLGLASAYLTGFRKGLGEGIDVLVEMDADLSHSPEDLPKLLQGASTHDLTIGSRYVPGGGVTNWGRGRRALSKGGNLYARMALGFPLTDATSGFRAYRRRALETLLSERIHSDGYAFQIELAYRAWRAGFTIGEVPITFREREHGRSKISRRIILEALWRVAQWGIRDRLRPRAGPPRSARDVDSAGARDQRR
jgi:apolipoprotein N-acyltransferase